MWSYQTQQSFARILLTGVCQFLSFGPPFVLDVPELDLQSRRRSIMQRTHAIRMMAVLAAAHKYMVRLFARGARLAIQASQDVFDSI